MKTYQQLKNFFFFKTFLCQSSQKNLSFFLSCFLFLILAKIATLITPIILGKPLIH